MLLASRWDMRVYIHTIRNQDKKYMRTEIKLHLQRMDAFVAPTVIDIVNPTFWLNESEDETDYVNSENLLKKIFQTNSFKMEFQITLKEYVTYTIPKLGIIICLGNVAG